MELILDEDGYFNDIILQSACPNLYDQTWAVETMFNRYVRTLNGAQLKELGLRLKVADGILDARAHALGAIRPSHRDKYDAYLCDELKSDVELFKYLFDSFKGEVENRYLKDESTAKLYAFIDKMSETLNKARQVYLLGSSGKNKEPAHEETIMELILREDGWFNPTVLQDIFPNLTAMEWEEGVGFKPYLLSLSRDQLDELGSRLHVLGDNIGDDSPTNRVRSAYERLCDDLEAENKARSSQTYQAFMVQEEQNIYLNSLTKDEQPIQDEPTSIEATLAQRKATHGDYADVSRIYCNLQRAVSEFLDDDSVPSEYRLSVNVILQKLARIAAGNPAFADHWHDIEGYARLAKTKVESDEKI